MSLPASIEAVVFDMDGVLWLSTPVHAWAFRETLARVNILDFDYPRYAGMSTTECLTRVFRDLGREVSEATIGELATEKSRLVLGALQRDPPVTESCCRVVGSLRSKYKLGLATSASPGTLEVFLEASGCRGLFSAVLCATSVGRLKPAPDIYLRACELLRVAPGNTLVVEDAVAGVIAGKSAGAWVWALPSTCPADALLAAGADRVIQNLEGLL